jgi:hypothetical protein
MDWKGLTEDLLLLEKLKKRFRELGCSRDDALQLATYLYMSQTPYETVVIRTKIISDNNINR